MSKFLGKYKAPEVLVDLSQGSAKLSFSKYCAKLKCCFADPHDVVKEILGSLSKSDTSDSHLVNYLNTFVKVTLKIEGKFENYGYSVKEILHW